MNKPSEAIGWRRLDWRLGWAWGFVTGFWLAAIFGTMLCVWKY